MNDLKSAFRQLLKNPGFTAVAVFTLAFGIGATTASFSVVNGVLLNPLPCEGPGQLVNLWETRQDKSRGGQTAETGFPGNWFTDPAPKIRPGL